MAKSYKVGSVTFKSQKDLASHIKHRLFQYAPGQRISSGHEDFDLWSFVVGSHPAALEKLGVGINYFEILLNPKFRHNEIWLVRLDGSRIDFTYKFWAKKSLRTNLLDAMRAAVEEQSLTFRRLSLKRHGRYVCALCDLEIEGAGEVDHYPLDFRFICEMFMAGRALPTRFRATFGNVVAFLPEDKDFEAPWVTFHKTYARLRLLCRPCHLDHTNRERDREGLRRAGGV